MKKWENSNRKKNGADGENEKHQQIDDAWKRYGDYSGTSEHTKNARHEISSVKNYIVNCPQKHTLHIFAIIARREHCFFYDTERERAFLKPLLMRPQHRNHMCANTSARTHGAHGHCLPGSNARTLYKLFRGEHTNTSAVKLKFTTHS